MVVKLPGLENKASQKPSTFIKKLSVFARDGLSSFFWYVSGTQWQSAETVHKIEVRDKNVATPKVFNELKAAFHIRLALDSFINIMILLSHLHTDKIIN